MATATTTTTTEKKPAICRVCKSRGFDNVLITFEKTNETKPDGSPKWNVFNASDKSPHEHRKPQAAAGPTEEQNQLLREIRDSLHELIRVWSAFPK